MEGFQSKLAQVFRSISVCIACMSQARSFMVKVTLAGKNWNFATVLLVKTVTLPRLKGFQITCNRCLPLEDDVSCSFSGWATILLVPDCFWWIDFNITVNMFTPRLFVIHLNQVRTWKLRWRCLSELFLGLCWRISTLLDTNVHLSQSCPWTRVIAKRSRSQFGQRSKLVSMYLSEL